MVIVRAGAFCSGVLFFLHVDGGTYRFGLFASSCFIRIIVTRDASSCLRASPAAAVGGSRWLVVVVIADVDR